MGARCPGDEPGERVVVPVAVHDGIDGAGVVGAADRLPEVGHCPAVHVLVAVAQQDAGQPRSAPRASWLARATIAGMSYPSRLASLSNRASRRRPAAFPKSAAHWRPHRSSTLPIIVALRFAVNDPDPPNQATANHATPRAGCYARTPAGHQGREAVLTRQRPLCQCRKREANPARLATHSTLAARSVPDALPSHMAVRWVGLRRPKASAKAAASPA